MLTDLDCRNNEISKLNVSGCPNLKKLICRNNRITNLDLSGNLQLEYLDVSDNKIPSRNLSFLSHLVNLQRINLGNGGYNRERERDGIFNRLTGSLESLERMSKLEWLNIDNTDISSGLEYLPNSIKYFFCSTKERKESKVKLIEQELRKFGKTETESLKLWRRANFDLIEVILENKKILTNLRQALANGATQDEVVSKGLDVFIFQIEDKVIEARRELYERQRSQILQSSPPKPF